LVRLDRFVALLLEWQNRVNLIAASTLECVWTRHVADSLQLLAQAPEARNWVDLGSGGGFPGMVIACALADDSAARVHLVESNGKKAAFLREAARITNAPAIIHPVRIEDFVHKFSESPQIVTARALAPLEQLLTTAYPLLKRGALGLFPKGQNVDAELTAATKYWKIQATLEPSVTEQKARIVVVRKLEPALDPRRAKPSTRT
jgi:16S rRNA (guanine527-N7)-methyltransferase